MYYEIRMYTPNKEKLQEYANVFHTYPEKVFENNGVSVMGMFEVDGTPQPAFVFMLAYRDKAHRDQVFAKLGEEPLMKEYRPKRAQLIDAAVPSANWLLKPVKHSKLG